MLYSEGISIKSILPFSIEENKCKIMTIKPYQDTYLRSNLLISNILHGRSHDKNEQKKDQIEQAHAQDSYINCEVELGKHHDRVIETQLKTELIKNRTNRIYQQAQQQILQKNRNATAQAQQIMKMKQAYKQKADMIMNRKDQSVYLGRKLLQTPGMLKTMKERQPSAKLTKLECTRKVMKQFSKVVSVDTKNVIENHITNQSGDKSSIVMDSSYLSDVSLSNFSLKTDNSDEKTNQKEMQAIKKMIKQRGFDCVVNEQRRRKAWQGFMCYWQHDPSRENGIKILKSSTQIDKNRKGNTKTNDKFLLLEQQSNAQKKTQNKREMISAFQNVINSYRLTSK